MMETRNQPTTVHVRLFHAFSHAAVSALALASTPDPRRHAEDKDPPGSQTESKRIEDKGARTGLSLVLAECKRAATAAPPALARRPLDALVDQVGLGCQSLPLTL